MKLLLGLLVAQVVWMAPGHADDVTPTSLVSLVMEPHRPEDVMAELSTEATSTTTQEPPELPKPKIFRMHVTSHIEYRFANTLIASRVGNPANVSQEVYFTVTLPETAFISKFLMEVDGKVYEATVKEKEEAKQVYDAAVAAGQGAAHVALSARNSNQFTVSVNVEPTKKVNFNLTYEELLTRRLGSYNHVINLDPGQLVSDLRVDVFIKENKNITVLRVPELRSGNEVDADESTTANPLARIERKSANEAHVSFAPTEEQQKQLGRVKGLDKEEQSGGPFDWYPRPTGPPKVVEGLGGQFVVQYDVDRADQAGEVLVNNGYFVHFFSPEQLEPLPKHALFVLDVSGSMAGRKIEQLKEAMNAILDDLNEADYFNIIEFSYSVTVWNLDETASSAVFSPYKSYSYDDAPKANSAPTPAFPATPEYIAKAKEIVTKMRAGGGTNIYDTLKTVIQVSRDGMENITDPLQEKRKPIIVFLTDGEPTVGETRLNKIFSVVQELNANPQAALFSLAFGDDADLDFLKKLSLKNAGFARKIYEASDAALQLRDFYRQISSPLLANVTFDYQPDKVETALTTRTRFHTLFSGSEIIVAGRVKDKDQQGPIEGHIWGLSYTGNTTYDIVRPYPVIHDEPHPVTSLERLWAYLTIQQLLEKQEAKDAEDEATALVEPSGAANETETKPALSPKKEALKLALQYSFVTPLTSLVVVKPNSTKETGTFKPGAGGYGSPALSAAMAPQRQIGNIGNRYLMRTGMSSGYSATNHGFAQAHQMPLPRGHPTSAHSKASLRHRKYSPSLHRGSHPTKLRAPAPGFAQRTMDRFGGPSYPLALGLPGAPGAPAAPGTAGQSFSSFQQSSQGRPGSFQSRPGIAGASGPLYSGTAGSPGFAGQPIQSQDFDYGSPISGPSLSNQRPSPRPVAQSTTFRPYPPPPTRTTTRTTTPEKKPVLMVLVSLEDLEWLEDATNSSDIITLPFDDLEGNSTFHLERNNETTAGQLEVCTTPGGLPGQCRHLAHCSLNIFQHDILAYKEFFCHIDNFAGACCPNWLFPETSTPQASGVETTPQASGVETTPASKTTAATAE